MPGPDDLASVVGRHPEAEAVVADVRDRDACEAAVARAIHRWGRLDAVVACAGVVGGGRPLWETSVEERDLLWDVNAKGVWNTAAATVPALLACPEPHNARFVAVASAAGAHGLFQMSAYTAAKHAVVGVVRGLAADLVGTGVTAVAVSPGSTDTTMLRETARLYDATAEELAAHQLLQRALHPEEVAATLSFCCSAAGAVLNGSVVSADGGFRS